MITEKLTPEERRIRKIEFFTKLKDLIKDYAVDIVYFDSTYSGTPECFGVTTDAHIGDSWDDTTFLKELNEDYLDFYIDELILDQNKK